jgi:hypothetical protein
MNIRHLFISIVLCATVLPAAYAAEGAAGHGGAAIVCQTEAQMLDLFEGENVYGLGFTAIQAASAAEIAEAVLKKLNAYPTFKTLLSEELAGVFKNARILNTDTRNIPTDDVNPIVTRAGCEIKPAAVYVKDQSIILIDRAIFSAFDVKNQAALYLHEAVYKIARDHVKASNSVTARKITAYLMSDTSDLSEISSDLANLRLLPYPDFKNYKMERNRAEGMSLKISPQDETLELNLNSTDSYLKGCVGTYRYHGSVGGLDRWISTSTLCSLDVVRALVPNRASRLWINVRTASFPDFAERLEAIAN